MCENDKLNNVLIIARALRAEATHCRIGK